MLRDNPALIGEDFHEPRHDAEWILEVECGEHYDFSLRSQIQTRSGIHPASAVCYLNFLFGGRNRRATVTTQFHLVPMLRIRENIQLLLSYPVVLK